MSLIVVGGQSRNVGKTSIAAGLIASIPEVHWTAVKLTVCKARECPVNGPGCACQDHEHPFYLAEEKNRDGQADSMRFLASGAKRAFWGRVKCHAFEAIIPELTAIIDSADHTIIESNSLVRYIRPDFYVTVLHPGVTDWKQSAIELLSQTDLAIITGDKTSGSMWPPGVKERLESIPKIEAASADNAFPELAAIVRARMAASARSKKEAL